MICFITARCAAEMRKNFVLNNLELFRCSQKDTIMGKMWRRRLRMYETAVSVSPRGLARPFRCGAGWQPAADW
jgi:hypothetical protein